MALIGSLQRAFVRGTGDLESSITVMAFLVSAYPIWRVSSFVVLGAEATESFSAPKKRWPLLLSQFGFWAVTALVSLVLIPFLGQWNHDQGVQAMRQKKYSAAIELFLRSLAQLQSSPSAHYALAEIYQELGDPEAATRHYWLGIYSDGGFPAAAFNNLSILLLARGDSARALDLLDLAEQRVSAELPDQRWGALGVISKNRAWAYFARGLYAQADENTERALRYLTPSGETREYPEVFCLKALLAERRDRPAAGGSSDEASSAQETSATIARERCLEGFEGRSEKSSHGAVRELYLQVLAGNQKDE